MAPVVSGFQGLAFFRGGSEGTNATGSRECPNGGRASGGDGVVALAGVESAVGGDAGNLLVGRDLVEEFGQHRGVADVTGGELRSTDFQ